MIDGELLSPSPPRSIIAASLLRRILRLRMRFTSYVDWFQSAQFDSSLDPGSQTTLFSRMQSTSEQERLVPFMGVCIKRAPCDLMIQTNY